MTVINQAIEEAQPDDSTTQSIVDNIPLPSGVTGTVQPQPEQLLNSTEDVPTLPSQVDFSQAGQIDTPQVPELVSTEGFEAPPTPLSDIEIPVLNTQNRNILYDGLPLQYDVDNPINFPEIESPNVAVESFPTLDNQLRGGLNSTQNPFRDTSSRFGALGGLFDFTRNLFTSEEVGEPIGLFGRNFQDFGTGNLGRLFYTLGLLQNTAMGVAADSGRALGAPIDAIRQGAGNLLDRGLEAARWIPQLSPLNVIPRSQEYRDAIREYYRLTEDGNHMPYVVRALAGRDLGFTNWQTDIEGNFSPFGVLGRVGETPDSQIPLRFFLGLALDVITDPITGVANDFVNAQRRVVSEANSSALVRSFVDEADIPIRSAVDLDSIPYYSRTTPEIQSEQFPFIIPIETPDVNYNISTLDVDNTTIDFGTAVIESTPRLSSTGEIQLRPPSSLARVQSINIPGTSVVADSIVPINPTPAINQDFYIPQLPFDRVPTRFLTGTTEINPSTPQLNAAVINSLTGNVIPTTLRTTYDDINRILSSIRSSDQSSIVLYNPPYRLQRTIDPIESTLPTDIVPYGLSDSEISQTLIRRGENTTLLERTLDDEIAEGERQIDELLARIPEDWVEEVAILRRTDDADTVELDPEFQSFIDDLDNIIDETANRLARSYVDGGDVSSDTLDDFLNRLEPTIADELRPRIEQELNTINITAESVPTRRELIGDYLGIPESRRTTSTDSEVLDNVAIRLSENDAPNILDEVLSGNYSDLTVPARRQIISGAVSAELTRLDAELSDVRGLTRRSFHPDDENLLDEFVTRVDDSTPQENTELFLQLRNDSELQPLTRYGMMNHILARLPDTEIERITRVVEEPTTRTLPTNVVRAEELETTRQIFMSPDRRTIYKTLEPQFSESTIRNSLEVLQRMRDTDLVPNITEYGDDFIGYEFFQSRPLVELIVDAVNNPEVKERVYGLTQQLGDALRVMDERGVGHPDMHLQNILVSDDNRIKIIDFDFVELMDGITNEYINDIIWDAPNFGLLDNSDTTLDLVLDLTQELDERVKRAQRIVPVATQTEPIVSATRLANTYEPGMRQFVRSKLNESRNIDEALIQRYLDTGEVTTELLLTIRNQPRIHGVVMPDDDLTSILVNIRDGDEYVINELTRVSPYPDDIDNNVAPVLYSRSARVLDNEENLVFLPGTVLRRVSNRYTVEVPQESTQLSAAQYLLDQVLNLDLSDTKAREAYYSTIPSNLRIDNPSDIYVDLLQRYYDADKTYTSALQQNSEISAQYASVASLDNPDIHILSELEEALLASDRTLDDMMTTREQTFSRLTQQATEERRNIHDESIRRENRRDENLGNGNRGGCL